MLRGGSPGRVQGVAKQARPRSRQAVDPAHGPHVGVVADGHLQRRFAGVEAHTGIGWRVGLLGDDHARADVELGGADDAVEFAEEVGGDLSAAYQATVRVAEVNQFGVEHAADAFQSGDDQLLACKNIGVGQTIGGHQGVDRDIESRSNGRQRIAWLNDVYGGDILRGGRMDQCEKRDDEQQQRKKFIHF